MDLRMDSLTSNQSFFVFPWGDNRLESDAVSLNTLPDETRRSLLQAASENRHAGTASISQLLADHSGAAESVYELLCDGLRAEREATSTAALLELLEKISLCDDIRTACFAVVNELQQFLAPDCQRIALGLCSGSSAKDPAAVGQARAGPCRLQAVSGVSQFDRRSEFTYSIEAALDEAILLDDVTVWPPSDGRAPASSLSHQKLCALIDTSSVISSPLRGQRGQIVGAWLLFGFENNIHRSGAESFVRAAQTKVGSVLELVKRAESGRIKKAVELCWKTRHTWKTRAMLAAVCGLSAMMMLPVSYKLSCDCELQPVTRRFVVAPYDGTLEKTLAEPGDIVNAGDVLARMDEREIRWELAGLEADHDRAEKRGSAALATQEVAEAQQAKLEMQGLELQMQLLRHRADHLSIKSPLSGIVVSGDLKKVEGAALTIGQSLYEIAPLDRMVLEVAIPEEEVAHAKLGQKVTFRVNAYPQQAWTGIIDRLRPRSEIREQANVFVAEVYLDNSLHQLRPGMSGRAKVITRRRPLAWNLFHRPYESLVMMLGW
jgi:biotin carboxyl carrier protein